MYHLAVDMINQLDRRLISLRARRWENFGAHLYWMPERGVHWGERLLVSLNVDSGCSFTLVFDAIWVSTVIRSFSDFLC